MHAGLGLLQRGGRLRPRREPAGQRAPGGGASPPVGRAHAVRSVARFAACCRLFSGALTVCLRLAGQSRRCSDPQGSRAEIDGGNRSQTHIPSLPACPSLLLLLIIIIHPSCLAPSGIWELAGRLSLFLPDLQDVRLFFYFNVLM